VESVISWVAALTGMFAATVVAWNHNARTTGVGFVIFTFSSVAWIIASMQRDDTSLLAQNAALLLINVLGVYRWLWRNGKS
jgi:hypothetical protein